MKKFIVALLAVLALAVPASAAAGTLSGYVKFNDGNLCTGCSVSIVNNSTGARGSTSTNSSGVYSFGNVALNTIYYIQATVYCPIRQMTYGSPTLNFSQSSGSSWRWDFVGSWAIVIDKPSCGH